MRNRIFCICLILTVIGQSFSSASAQVKQIIQGADKPWLYEFVVDPAPAVQPAFKYRLLPDLTVQHPGNAATSYYRALYLFLAHSEQDRKEFDECANFGFMIRPDRTTSDGKVIQHIPISGEIARLRSLVAKFADVLGELEIAATRETCDWGIDLQEQTGQETAGFDAIRKLAPQFAAMRQLARLIQLKARVAIFDGKYDEVITQMQLGFRLGRDIARCPVTIASAIGTAISIQMQVLLMEIIAEPNTPNFYWALTSIPRPMIDIRPGVERELNMAYGLPIFRAVEHPRSPEEWTQRWIQVLKVAHLLLPDLANAGAKQSEPNSRREVLDLVTREYPRAKSELVHFGFRAERIAEMPEMQVLAIHLARIGGFKRDEILKSIYLPYHQVSLRTRLNDKTKMATADSSDITTMKEVIPLFESQIQWIEQARVASVRLDCLLVRLQTIEALRMHAAANAGQLPSSLSEITQVPIPTNPVTGQPIIYRLEGETAVLEFPSPNLIATYGEIIRIKIRRKN